MSWSPPFQYEKFVQCEGLHDIDTKNGMAWHDMSDQICLWLNLATHDRPLLKNLWLHTYGHAEAVPSRAFGAHQLSAFEGLWRAPALVLQILWAWNAQKLLLILDSHLLPTRVRASPWLRQFSCWPNLVKRGHTSLLPLVWSGLIIFRFLSFIHLLKTRFCLPFRFFPNRACVLCCSHCILIFLHSYWITRWRKKIVIKSF